ncbi:hypothetical protein BaRGS_00021014, partial [Batillaria attramentaria]
SDFCLVVEDSSVDIALTHKISTTLTLGFSQPLGELKDRPVSVLSRVLPTFQLLNSCRRPSKWRHFLYPETAHFETQMRLPCAARLS